MIKKYKQVLLILLTVSLTNTFYSQTNRPGRAAEKDPEEYIENRDSTWGLDFDFSQLDPAKVRMNVLTYKLAKLKAYNDSMMNLIRARNIRERSDSLEQLYDLLSGDTTTDYNAYSFFVGQYHSTVSGINKALSNASWPKFDGMGYHFTNIADFTWKRGRKINDIYIAVGSAKTVSKGDVSLSYSYFSPVNYNFGYAILDKKRVQFFPILGLGYQSSDLTFSNSAFDPFELGSGLYDSLLKATTTNKRGVEYKFKKREIMLHYGAELDFHLFYSKRKVGFIVGLRAMGNQAMLSTGWRFDGKKYSQLGGVNINDYHFDLVFRVYARRMGKRGTYYLRNNWWESYY